MSVRLLRKPTPGTAFVLGGGGNLGAVQVGMLQALFEQGVVPEVVIGCSVGALNAAGVAADPTLAGVRKMREVWLNLNGDELWPAGRISGLWMLGRKGQAIQPSTGLRRPIDVLLQSFSIARNHRFLAETDDPPPEVELVVLPGVDPGRIKRNDFSRSRDLMDRAYVAATEFLGGRGVAAAGR